MIAEDPNSNRKKNDRRSPPSSLAGAATRARSDTVKTGSHGGARLREDPHEHDERKERKQSGKDDGPLDEVTRPVHRHRMNRERRSTDARPRRGLRLRARGRRRGIRPPHRPQQVVQQLVQRQRARDMERPGSRCDASPCAPKDLDDGEGKQGGNSQLETETDAWRKYKKPLSGEKKHVVEMGGFPMKGR